MQNVAAADEGIAADPVAPVAEVMVAVAADAAIAEVSVLVE